MLRSNKLKMLLKFTWAILSVEIIRCATYSDVRERRTREKDEKEEDDDEEKKKKKDEREDQSPYL